MPIHRALLLGILLALPVAAQVEVPVAVDDTAITARIETMYLLNQHLNPFNINTTTNEGVVTITGSVNDQVQKDLAGELANSVEGVKQVVNHITVVPTVIGEKERRSWKQRIEDKTITTSVRARLVYHRQFKGLSIGVNTVNGIVTLSGVVPSEEKRLAIAEVARDTQAVEGVINNLVIRPQDNVTPVEAVGRQFTSEWLESRVRTSIIFNRHLSIRELGVKVVDDVCVLSGSVASEEKKQLAGDVAASIQGIASVDNQITVRTGEEEVIPGTRPRRATPPEATEDPVGAAPAVPDPEPAPEAQTDDEVPLLEPLEPLAPKVDASELPAP